MKTREAWYAVVGGCVGAVLTMAVCSILPLGVQSQLDGSFGEIVCTGLKVVSPDGIGRVILGHYSAGYYGIQVLGEDGVIRVYMGTAIGAGDRENGETNVWGENRSSLATMGVSEHGGEYGGHGGTVGVYGKFGTYAGMKIYEHGGNVNVSGNYTHAAIGITEHGGKVHVYDEHSGKAAQMFTTEHGGRVKVVNKEGNTRAAIGINEYGNGAVSTWDKNGYRLRR